MSFTAFRDWLRQTLGLSHSQLEGVAASLVIIFLLWFARFLVLLVVRRRTEDVRTLYHWKKLSGYVAGVLGVLLVGRVWFEGVQSLATFLGLLSAGVAIALKDPLANLAGWTFILWRRPFEVGDRIEIGGVAGDVIDQRLFQFTVLEIGNWVHADQSTGRIVNIPNGRVFTDPLANYTRGFHFIWNEIPVLITFESDWQKAKEILTHLAEKHSQHLSVQAEAEVKKAARQYMILYSRFTPKVYTTVEDSGVLLTIRHVCEPRQRRGTAEAIWEDILRAFAAAPDIDFAYPTHRFYDHGTEGKLGMRPGRQAAAETLPDAPPPTAPKPDGGEPR